MVGMICPDETKLIEYFSNDLCSKNNMEIEEHSFECEFCAEKMRNYYQCYSVIEAIKSKTSNTNSSFYDVAFFPAASSYENRGVSEINTINNKFKISLKPFLKGDKSILEIQVLDSCVDGIITIENENGIIFKSKIVNGFASEEIQNPIDLREVAISLSK